MSVEIRTNFKAMKKQIKELSNTEMKKNMGKIGVRTLSLNFDQIESGRDVNNRKFPAYTARYQAIRDSRGQDSRVDLRITSEMLNSLDIQKVAPDSVTIGFPNDREKRKAIGVLNNKKRPIHFVGLTKTNTKKLVKYANSEIIT